MKSEYVGNIKDYLNSSSGKFLCFNYTCNVLLKEYATIIYNNGLPDPVAIPD